MPGMPGKHVMGAEELTLSAVFTRVLLIYDLLPVYDLLLALLLAAIGSQLLISA
jgi:hypothetical protein